MSVSASTAPADSVGKPSPSGVSEAGASSINLSSELKKEPERSNRISSLVPSNSPVNSARLSETIAEERFEAGFDLLEIQTAFNVLEETIWNRVLEALEPRDFAEAIGLVRAILGLGKDALARRYVSMAAQVKAPSLDYKELFKGTV